MRMLNAAFAPYGIGIAAVASLESALSAPLASTALTA
jgi:hypothetical protein